MTHKRYCLVWDNGHDTSGIEFDTYEEAKKNMEETYILWEDAEVSTWNIKKGLIRPTPKQIESWNQMIDECCCYIVRWNDVLGEYEDSYWAEFLADEELREIGWVHWEEVERVWE